MWGISVSAAVVSDILLIVLQSLRSRQNEKINVSCEISISTAYVMEDIRSGTHFL